VVQVPVEISPRIRSAMGCLQQPASGEITVYVNGQKINSPFGRSPWLRFAGRDRNLHIGWNSLAIQVNSEAFSPAVIAGITLDREDGEIDHVQSNDQWKAQTRKRMAGSVQSSTMRSGRE